MSNSMFGRAASMDLTQPAPGVQQTLQQAHAFDQQPPQQSMQSVQQIDLQRQGPRFGAP